MPLQLARVMMDTTVFQGVGVSVTPVQWGPIAIQGTPPSCAGLVCFLIPLGHLSVLAALRTADHLFLGATLFSHVFVFQDLL